MTGEGSALASALFRLMGLGVAGLLITACNPAVTTTPAVQSTSRFATVSGPIMRETLPPTWTPSATATASPIPSVTPTPSPTATESADAICAGFEMMVDFSARRAYPWGGYIPVFVRLDSPAASIHFEVTQRGGEESTGFDLPGGQVVGVQFQISALPGPGTYDWLLSARSEAYGDLCSREGSFVALRPTPTPAFTLTPEATTGPDSW